MFWRENREENGGPPSGQVRVLIVGDSGVGKTSLVHLVMTGSSIAQPTQTVGCNVAVKLMQHITYGSSTSSSNNIRGDSDRDFFVELWDFSGHDRYKDCRSLFYSQINGVVFVHDLSERRTKTSLNKWAAEISATGTFSTPLSSGGSSGLPVPFIVLGNKADISVKEGARGSSGSVVDVTRQWVGRQGLLPLNEELPLAESFPSSGGLLALIRRRYLPDELSGSTPWPAQVNRTFLGSGEISNDHDQQYKNSSSALGQPYKYDVLPPLPAQHNLTPPPTLYPQQPMSKPDNYDIPRFALANSEDIARSRSRHMDINV